MGMLPLTYEVTKMKDFSIIMNYKKSTKGTHVYEGPENSIPSVYIRKEAFGGDPAPEKIQVDVSIPGDKQ